MASESEMVMMSLLNSFFGLFGRRATKITFIGHEREGGYTFLTSPELKGFSIMLEPGEDNLKGILGALEQPLDAYLEARRAFQKAKQRRSDLTGLRITQHHPMNLVAELCPA
jgi:hypothetical protein